MSSLYRHLAEGAFLVVEVFSIHARMSFLKIVGKLVLLDPAPRMVLVVNPNRPERVRHLTVVTNEMW